MSAKNDENYSKYSQIREWINLMNDEIKELKQTYMTSITSDTNIAFREEVFDAVLPYTMDYIDNTMTHDEIVKVLGPYEIVDSVTGAKIIPYDEVSTDDGEVKEEYSLVLKNTMKTIKEYSLVLLQLEKEEEDIKEKTSEIMNEYIHYLASNQLFTNKEETLRIFKESMEFESDPEVKRVTENRIKVLENEITYKFLTERLEKYGDKERDAIMDDFFKNDKSLYMLKKFKSKIKKFGFNPDIFKYFLNLEENFLEEKYHVYNNLFLIIYMRYVAHACYDIKSERIYVLAITTAISSLVYHTFDNDDTERKFINFIRNTIDMFVSDDPYTQSKVFSKFSLENRTYKNHPERLRVDELNTQMKKDVLRKKFEEYNIENPFGDDFDIDEATKYFNEKIKELKDSQLEDAKEIIDSTNSYQDTIDDFDDIVGHIEDTAESINNDNMSDNDNNEDTDKDIDESVSEEITEEPSAPTSIEEGTDESLQDVNDQVGLDGIYDAVNSLSSDDEQ